MHLIISWFYSLGKISGIVPEPKLKNWKTEKLKNWIFQRDPGRDSPYGFSFSVFLFFSFAYGTFPETFRNICGETEKLKNRKTEFSREIQEEILHRDSVFQFFCFLVLLTEHFRRHFGIFAEKLKNRKTEFSREIQEEILHRDSVFQFFSFSVFQFCGRIGQEELDNCQRKFGCETSELRTFKNAQSNRFVK